jgi:hypothetical protein
VTIVTKIVSIGCDRLFAECAFLWITSRRLLQGSGLHADGVVMRTTSSARAVSANCYALSAGKNDRRRTSKFSQPSHAFIRAWRTKKPLGGLSHFAWEAMDSEFR